MTQCARLYQGISIPIDSLAILNRLDYANALLGGLRQTDLDRLQRVQNCAARVISRTKIRDRITPILCDLHWLPVTSRIQFKLCVCMYKVIHGAAPDYICSEPTLYPKERCDLATMDSYSTSLWDKKMQLHLIL